MRTKRKWKVYGMDLLFYLAGSCLFSISVVVFAVPNQIAPGGMTGISTILNRLFGTPIGSVALLINFPILIFGFWRLSVGLMMKTLFVLIFGSFMMDWLPLFLPVYHGNGMLAAVAAGVLEGFGLSLIFLRGATTGGTDIVARLITQKRPHFSIGRCMFAVDFVIILVSVFAYGNLESGLYAWIAVFFSTRVIDFVLYGFSKGSGAALFIISNKWEAIRDYILKTQSRGVTIIEGKGAFSGQYRPILFCAVRKNELSLLQQKIYQIDSDAFLVAGTASAIIGAGFLQQTKEKTILDLLQKK